MMLKNHTIYELIAPSTVLEAICYRSARSPYISLNNRSRKRKKKLTLQTRESSDLQMNWKEIYIGMVTRSPEKERNPKQKKSASSDEDMVAYKQLETVLDQFFGFSYDKHMETRKVGYT